MDSIARAVRQAHHKQTPDKHASRAPLVVLRDGGYHVTGGELVANAVLRRIQDGAKGTKIVRVCIEERCGTYVCDDHVELDCHGYPDGITLFDNVDALQSRIVSTLDATSGPQEHCCIFSIDGGVSSLVCRHGARRIAHLVDAIRRNQKTYCVVLGSVHGDMHEGHEVSFLCPDPVAEVHILAEGNLCIHLATAKGCKKTERCKFDISSTAGIEFREEDEQEALLKPPKRPGMSSNASRHGERSERLEAERRAKSNVVLPYERQGQARQYATDADFREYLPVEAGGWANQHRNKDNDTDAALERTTHRLGTITYLRGDSDESYDSDEDPDDDIDI